MILENKDIAENIIKKKNKNRNNKSIKKNKRESVLYVCEERYEDIFLYYEKNEKMKK